MDIGIRVLESISGRRREAFVQLCAKVKSRTRLTAVIGIKRTCAGSRFVHRVFPV